MKWEEANKHKWISHAVKQNEKDAKRNGSENNRARSFSNRKSSKTKNLEERARMLYAGGRFVINPECTPWLKKWDGLMGTWLVFICLVTPFEVGFLRVELNWLFWVNRCIDVTFVVDMVISCFVMFPIQTRYGVKWISKARDIRRHYFRRYFVIDFVSILPFDVLALLVSARTLEKFKIFRTVRLFRILKMVRIMRASRLYKRYETNFSWSYRKASLLSFGFVIWLLAHWISAVWGLTGQLSGSPMCKTDEDFEAAMAVGSLERSANGPCEVTWPEVFFKERAAFIVDWPFNYYAASMYFAVYSITGVGYGDILPQNQNERGICIVLMILCGAFWAYLIGTACSIASSLDEYALEFQRHIDDLNELMANRNMPGELRVRLRRYFHQTKHCISGRLSQEQALLEMLSPQLKCECLDIIHGAFIRRIWFVQKTSSTFQRELSMQLVTRYFAQEEWFGSPWTAFIIVRGVARRRGKLLVSHSVFGEEQLLLESYWLAYQDPAWALSFIECLTLTKQKLMNLAQYHPDASSDLRRAHIKLAIVFGMLHVYRQMRNAAENTQNISGKTKVFGSENSLVEKQLTTENEVIAKKMAAEENQPFELKPESLQAIASLTAALVIQTFQSQNVKGICTSAIESDQETPDAADTEQEILDPCSSKPPISPSKHAKLQELIANAPMPRSASKLLSKSSRSSALKESSAFENGQEIDVATLQEIIANAPMPRYASKLSHTSRRSSASKGSGALKNSQEIQEVKPQPFELPMPSLIQQAQWQSHQTALQSDAYDEKPLEKPLSDLEALGLLMTDRHQKQIVNGKGRKELMEEAVANGQDILTRMQDQRQLLLWHQACVSPAARAAGAMQDPATWGQAKNEEEASEESVTRSTRARAACQL